MAVLGYWTVVPLQKNKLLLNPCGRPLHCLTFPIPLHHSSPPSHSPFRHEREVLVQYIISYLICHMRYWAMPLLAPAGIERKHSSVGRAAQDNHLDLG